MTLIKELQGIKSTKSDLRKFGLLVGFVFLIVGLIFHNVYLVVVATTLIIFGMLFPRALRPFQKLWMISAVIMGWVMSRVILSLLFFLVVTPVAFCARMFGKRFFETAPRKRTKSYWRVHEQYRGKESYERQF